MDVKNNNNNKYEKDGEPINYARITRKIRDDYIAGKLKANEFIILMWLHLDADPYKGIIYVNYEELAKTFQGKLGEKNNINRTFLSLRRKNYVHFENHTGKRGPIRTELNYFILPKNQYKKINTKEIRGENRGNIRAENKSSSEVEQSLEGHNQRLETIKKDLTKRIDWDRELDGFRGDNNDNDINNLKIDNKNLKKVENFQPKSHEEFICKKTAEILREDHINFVLSVYRKHGVGLVEEALRQYEESDKESIEKPGAYFNKIVANLIAEKKRSS